MKIFEDVKYKECSDSYHYVDIYMPDGECSALFLYFHGGGLIEGSRKELTASHPFVKEMTEAGFGVASAEYRLYPDAGYPDFVEDAAEAVAFVKHSFSKYGTYGKLIVGGCSAGAYIAQMLCFNKSFFEAVGVDPSEIDAYVHDAGQPTVHFNVLRERGFDHRRIMIDKQAPLYYVGTAKVSFENCSVSMIGRFEQDEDGSGSWYEGDDDKTLLSYGLFVNAWRELPKQYKGE